MIPAVLARIDPLSAAVGGAGALALLLPLYAFVIIPSAVDEALAELRAEYAEAAVQHTIDARKAAEVAEQEVRDADPQDLRCIVDGSC